jgi:hypothetical protein
MGILNIDLVTSIIDISLLSFLISRMEKQTLYMCIQYLGG